MTAKNKKLNVAKKQALPKVVTEKDWSKALKKMISKEKKLQKAQDKLNFERRQMPMVKIGKNYIFDGPNGKVSLLELFAGRNQLIVYHFMYHPEDDRFCVGCSFFGDQLSHLAHLNARDTSFTMISRAPLKSIERHKKKLEWTTPWISSLNTTFNEDFGVSGKDFETHGISVFIRDGDDIYRTYFTTDRGVEKLGTTWSFLDIVPYGRQEKWEKSPKGWPQSEPFVWWRFHDEY